MIRETLFLRPLAPAHLGWPCLTCSAAVDRGAGDLYDGRGVYLGPYCDRDCASRDPFLGTDTYRIVATPS